MRISIIIPTYNYGEYINDCIQSVIDQMHAEDEIIVVDDGSTDDTNIIVNTINCHNLRYLWQTNSGPSAARNNGFIYAKGTHVIFLDSDDMLGESQLDSFKKSARANPGNVVYGPSIRYDNQSGRKLPFEQYGKSDQEDLLKAWLLGWYIPTCALMWPREVFDNLGGFDLRYTADEDGEFAKRALIHGVEFVYCEASPAWIRDHRNKEIPSLSKDRSEAALNQRFQVILRLETLMKNKDIFPYYKKELAFAFYALGKNHVSSNPEFASKCYQEFKRLRPWGKPPGSILNWIGVSVLGLEKKEKLARYVQSRIRR